MKPLAILVPALLALAGCGGGNANRPDGTANPTPVATLGSASLDLAIANLTSPVAATTMVGTGGATGSLSIIDTGQVQAGVIDLKAVLLRVKYLANGSLTQTLSLHLVHTKALAIGDTFAFDGTTNTADYTEAKVTTSGMFVGEGITTAWGTATGGTATVMALNGATVTLSLKGVALTMGDPYPNPISVSGNMTGTVTLPVI